MRPLLFTVLLTLVVQAQDYASELPRIAPLEPAAALASFELRSPQLRIEAVAVEPLVTDPVAIAFDAEGAMLVVEMRGYSEDRDKNLGRVRRLTGTTGDGRFDHATTYAEGLSWPTAVACWDGGIFVAAAPDIWYFKDQDDDGVAEVRRRVFTGFRRNNVQALPNSLRWSLDNRIEGVTSLSGGKVDGIELRGRDFAFDPHSLELEPISGGAQYGRTADDWGNVFVASNSDHLQAILFEDRYAARNPDIASPPARKSIAPDGRQAPVFRSSPVEPWRKVRTRLRVAGTVGGPIEGGGRAAGYFTGTSGIHIYRGDALPDYRGSVFIADVGSNLVHRKVLHPDGYSFRGERVDSNSEFLTSTDIWFRPVQVTGGPDGALYIVDMYREVIEHPKSLPPMIKKHLDLTSGRDRGRIYRIRPKTLPRRAAQSPIDQLSSDNAWHRETASRLLVEQADPGHIPALEDLALSGKPLARLHALYLLASFEALKPAHLLPALRAEQPDLRRHAIRLSEAVDAPELGEALAGMTGDSSAHVRLQLAFSTGLGEPEGELMRFALQRPTVARRPGQVVKSSTTSDRSEVLAAYRPVLEMTGDPAKGGQHFQANCASCHRSDLGPGLNLMRDHSPEALLHHILDPNREVSPAFQLFTLTGPAHSYAGIILAESASSLSILQPNGETLNVLRKHVPQIQSTGVSLMPEGLETALPPQAMADLIAFIKAPPVTSELQIATFAVDATPPLGSPLAYNTLKKEGGKLSCRGLVLMPRDQQPIVMAVIDWIGVGNDAHLAFREALARGAGTTVERVAFHALHQHDAPRCDFRASTLLVANGHAPDMFNVDYARGTLARLEAAVRAAPPYPVSAIGVGETDVHEVASNRRILGSNGKVRVTRFTACRDPKIRAEPVGLIDPKLKLISFWNGEQPLASLSYYAVHPQSYYRTGTTSPDFPGLARNARDAALPGVLHVHFNGAGGNLGAGKWNDGSHANRPVLAKKVETAMASAWEAARDARQPITAADIGWEFQPVLLPPSEHTSIHQLKEALADPRTARVHRLRGAVNLAWLERCEAKDPIQISCLRLGSTRVIHMPGELFVEYQLMAQKMRPDLFVAMAAYGDYGPGYIGTEISYDQGGYETTPMGSRVSPAVEAVLTDVLQKLLR